MEAAEKDAQQDKVDNEGTFVCFKCGMTEHYDYKGTQPPFCKKIRLLPESYVMKDPFSPPNSGHFLILGYDCSICKKSACPECSIFYCKPFCLVCGLENVDKFPKQVGARIIAMKT